MIESQSALGAKGQIVNGNIFKTDEGVECRICSDDFNVRGNGVAGCVLYGPFTHDHFFRVYGEREEEGKRSFIDYAPPENINFVITEDDLLFVTTKNRRFLCHQAWLNRRVPGKKDRRPIIEDGKLVRGADGTPKCSDGVWNEDLEFVPDETQSPQFP